MMIKNNIAILFYVLLFFCIILLQLKSTGPAGAAMDSAIGQAPPAEMVLIKGGIFTMGSDIDEIEKIALQFHSESLEWYMDETPAHIVQLEDFHIDKHETTVSQYRIYIEATGKPAPKFMDDEKFGKANHPIVGVTWLEASDYCRWTSKRLPTEQEWEKAARGTDRRMYPWGNEADPKRTNTRGKGDNQRYTSTVDGFSEGKSPYGVLNMAGNVWEWTQDWYLPYPGNETPNDMFGKTLKVIRGGSWKANMDLARSAVRGKAMPDQRQYYIGFRCVKQP